MTSQTLEKLNRMEAREAMEALRKCCGSSRWVTEMVAARPFGSAGLLFTAAERVWSGASRDDILEAFSHHPKIGSDVASLRAKFASTAQWASGEQSGVREASEETLSSLAQGNRDYEAKFGHIFIVCATGKSAQQMLAMLRERLKNDPNSELAVAAAEQAKITRIRLEKLEL